MPTRQIVLNLSEDEFGGPVPSNGRFVATASKTRIAGASVTVPQTLSRDIVDGEFVAPVFLEVNATPPEWLWFVQIRDEEDTVMLRRTVIVPNGPGTIGFGDLPVVDPRSLVPEAEPEAGWWAAVKMRPVIVRLTQVEYDALTPEQQDDPYTLYLVPEVS